jgi:hypothetical protein
MTHLLLRLFVTLWPGRSGLFAESSERQIDDLDPLLAVDDAIAPYGVEIGERLFRDGFLRLNVNTVLPGFDSSRQTLPPCSSAIRRARVSPRPVPVGFPAVTNGSNNVLRTDAGTIVRDCDVDPFIDFRKVDLHLRHVS